MSPHVTTVLRLGVLRAIGGRFQFDPTPNLPDLKVNEDAEFEVVWHYEEVSRARETFRVRLELDGLGAPVAVQAAVDDVPVSTEDAWGRLRAPFRIASRGAAKVHYDLRAAYRAGSWTSAEMDGTDFRVEGDLVLRVR